MSGRVSADGGIMQKLLRTILHTKKTRSASTETHGRQGGHVMVRARKIVSCVCASVLVVAGTSIITASPASADPSTAGIGTQSPGVIAPGGTVTYVVTTTTETSESADENLTAAPGTLPAGASFLVLASALHPACQQTVASPSLASPNTYTWTCLLYTSDAADE